MEKRLKPQSINKYNTALRFFYETTLSKTFNLKAIPRCRAAAKLPVLLTREELWRLFDVCELKDKAIFMTFYGSGIRLAELTNLKVSDIDSKNMQIFVRQGKHKKDRWALLSGSNLEILREYWKEYRPKEWLFESLPGEWLQHSCHPTHASAKPQKSRYRQARYHTYLATLFRYSLDGRRRRRLSYQEAHGTRQHRIDRSLCPYDQSEYAECHQSSRQDRRAEQWLQGLRCRISSRPLAINIGKSIIFRYSISKPCQP